MKNTVLCFSSETCNTGIPVLSQETGFAGEGEPSDDDDMRRRQKTTTVYANYTPMLVTLSNLRSYQHPENNLVLACNSL